MEKTKTTIKETENNNMKEKLRKEATTEQQHQTTVKMMSLLE